MGESLALGGVPLMLVHSLMHAFIQDLLAGRPSVPGTRHGAARPPSAATLCVVPQAAGAPLVLACFPRVCTSVLVQWVHPLSPSICPLTSSLGLLASLPPLNPHQYQRKR